MKFLSWTLTLILCCFTGYLHAQFLSNPSFEGEAIQDFPPDGWSSCETGSSPDTQPGAYGVTLPAIDGQTYLGLVSRGPGGLYPNRTEKASTTLLSPLDAGTRYLFTAQLAFSSVLGHVLPWNGQFQAYDQPLQLEVWGGNNSCQEDELLWRSPPIEHKNWQAYQVVITPVKPISQLVIKAAFVAPNENYFGNILVDALSLEEASSSLMLPNVFTPNEDGSLDEFLPFDLVDVSQYQVKVFDRWGKLVFQADDPQEGWNGYCSGQICPEGTYFWVVEYGGENGQISQEKGSVTLLR